MDFGMPCRNCASEHNCAVRTAGCSLGVGWARNMAASAPGPQTQTLLGNAAALVSTGSLIIAALTLRHARSKQRRPHITMANTPFNTSIVNHMPSLAKEYRPYPWLTNGHVETIWAALFRRGANVRYYRRCLGMSDGGVVSLDFEYPQKDLPDAAPVLILLPGLTGGSDDTYVQHAVAQARDAGIRAVVFNSRGTAHGPVTTPQFYSASFTGDIRAVVDHVRAEHPQSLLMAAGWSLGANILVRYLGEEGAATPLVAAVSMCNPFDLVLSDANFQKGFNRFYDGRLAKSLRNIFLGHESLFLARGGDLRPDVAAASTSIREFDDAITRVTFGWPSVDAYYAGSCSSDSIPQVKIPLFCIQAEDDPIAPEAAIPYDAISANPNCILAVTATGGHLGWVSRDQGMFGGPWTDHVTVEYMTAIVKVLQKRALPDDVPGKLLGQENEEISPVYEGAAPV